MARMTLLDIAKANGSDGLVGLIDETSKAHPEITVAAARTIKGRLYKTLVRTGLPTVSFRDANEGVTASKGTTENRLIETFILNPRIETDKAVADGHEDGPEAAIAIEGEATLEATMQHLASQFYYGTSNDVKGCPGLLAAYDSTNMVVDAGGTSANTGSSVWAVKFGPKDVQWVFGENGMLDLSDVRIETLYDASSNPFTGYVQELLAYPGLQVGSTRSIGRIKKLTAETSKTLTDDLISDLLSKFPAGVRPDVLLMSRRSVKQLQQSRTATNATGAPAPFPSESFGVPIQVTDAIVDTEALTL